MECKDNENDQNEKFLAKSFLKLFTFLPFINI